MATYSLDLVFEGDPRADLPGPARAYVALKTWSEVAERPVITPDCVSVGEFENQIRRLKDELDTILAKAAKEFTAYKKVQMQHLSLRRP